MEEQKVKWIAAVKTEKFELLLQKEFPYYYIDVDVRRDIVAEIENIWQLWAIEDCLVSCDVARNDG